MPLQTEKSRLGLWDAVGDSELRLELQSGSRPCSWAASGLVSSGTGGNQSSGCAYATLMTSPVANR